MEKRNNYFSWIIATWFGSGLLPIAPGTWGSLAAFPFAYIISVYSGPNVLIIGTIILFFIGVQASNNVEKSAQEKDPKFIVVDEVVGQWIALLPLSFLNNYVGPDLPYWLFVPIAVVAFLAFRIYDIWKPWPINYIDKNVPGGLGIMLDDVIAGAYALIITSAMTVVMTFYYI
ncbi:MAG: Phosphatidylglycerophosphatase A [Candidatus Scalindua arabica]|uniref:Phosphatidylglycerophosphatase A n=1 Tax=Candidatus Scalindua arabica TaxID=1127984 RepID=A0A941W4T1_9BACT|nr:Phosphatidylglycerophosphatase A [Candidatus Scalindua arabica]